MIRSVDYGFVADIHTPHLDAERLAAARRAAVPGSHAETILKESLLDREYDVSNVADDVANATANGDYVLTSFPTGHFRRANLLVRSEFLAMAYVGDGQLDLADPQGYVDHTLERLLRFEPSAIMYRLCDYDVPDFHFLEARFARNRRGSGPARGAQGLIDNRDLVDLDIRIIRALLDAGLEVRVLIPFIQFPSQLGTLHAMIREAIPEERVKIGMMVEVPANLWSIEDYGRASFFVFGPSDLLKYLYGGIDRNDRSYAKVNSRILVDPISKALFAIDRLGQREVHCAKILVDLWHDLPTAEMARTRCQRLLMPSQIAHPISPG